MILDRHAPCHNVIRGQSERPAIRIQTYTHEEASTSSGRVVAKLNEKTDLLYGDVETRNEWWTGSCLKYQGVTHLLFLANGTKGTL